MAERHVGLTGLAVMGQNLARNIASKGFPIAVHNRTGEKTEQFMREFGHEGDLVGCESPEDFVKAIERPRSIIIMVKAGAPVDAVIDGLLPLLDEGDCLIDGGNSLYTETQRRCERLAGEGLLFLGTGVSGGEEGALHGPSMMPGGTRDAYDLVEPMLTAIAAKAPDGEACCTYIGDGGAGHYVKMVHNGIEYADMQLIAEAYDVLKHGAGLSNDELRDVFLQWNSGDLDSFLIQITARIFAMADDDGERLVDVVMDRAAMKGTGVWTSNSALDLGSPATAITEAVFARALSMLKDERVAASRVLPGPAAAGAEAGFGVDRDQLVDDVRQALYASKVVAYAQGFDLMTRASQLHGWGLKPGPIAGIWRAGCIIRARFLDRIKEAYADQPELQNLLLAPYFTEAVGAGQAAWRRVVAGAATTGIPVPAFSSALAYYDGYRRERLPANLIQAQRDLFGAHTYERTDREGSFHTEWA